MNIAVLTGSPHRQGATFLLAERFIQGAQAAGHAVFRFDAAFEAVHPCIGCDHCRAHDHACVFKDGMESLNPHLLDADLVALVTPLYFYGLSAQLKAALDRFYANDDRLMGGRQAALLAACADDAPEAMDALAASYRAMIGYLKWTDRGRVLALGCAARADIERTGYPEQAYALGRGL
ncbi:MAG: flavodoxin family protein [Christensenellales bacterium]|jgi:multimeric flavodoxin WrbA